MAEKLGPFIEQSNAGCDGEQHGATGTLIIPPEHHQHDVNRTAIDAADSDKDEFLALLAHELRNPLNPMMAALAVLEREDPPEADAKQAREVLRRQLAHLTSLIGQLLDAANVRRGAVELHCGPCDFTALVQMAVKDYERFFRSRGITLHVNIPPAPVLLHIDATRITQVISNLLNNAGNFTDPNGWVRVTLATDAVVAVLSVQDSGSGIDAAALRRVFERKKRYATEADSRRGLGLGLPLVKAFVESHGGTVAVHSAGRGHGSTFSIRLPLAPS